MQCKQLWLIFVLCEWTKKNGSLICRVVRTVKKDKNIVTSFSFGKGEERHLLFNPFGNPMDRNCYSCTSIGNWSTFYTSLSHTYRQNNISIIIKKKKDHTSNNLRKRREVVPVGKGFSRRIAASTKFETTRIPGNTKVDCATTIIIDDIIGRQLLLLLISATTDCRRRSVFHCV